MACKPFLKELSNITETVSRLITAYNVLIGALNIGGNAILIWALHRTRQTKTVSFQFIAVMSAGDLIAGLIAITLLTLISLEPYWEHCWLISTIQVTLTICNSFSILMVVLIALDRLLHMKYLERYSSILTKRRGHLLIMPSLLFTFLTSAVFMLPLPPDAYAVWQSVFFALAVLLLISILVLYYYALRALRLKACHLTRSILNQNRILGKAAKRISICILLLTTPLVVLLMLDGINKRHSFIKESDLNVCIWFAYITLLSNGFCSSIIFITQNRPIHVFLRRMIWYPYNRIRAMVGATEADT